MTMLLVPGALRRVVPLRRPGTVTDAVFGKVPAQRRSIACCIASGTRGK